jgi:hypothetical protein
MGIDSWSGACVHFIGVRKLWRRKPLLATYGHKVMFSAGARTLGHAHRGSHAGARALGMARLGWCAGLARWGLHFIGVRKLWRRKPLLATYGHKVMFSAGARALGLARWGMRAGARALGLARWGSRAGALALGSRAGDGALGLARWS